jgi:SSS family solute:Na+ symporter
MFIMLAVSLFIVAGHHGGMIAAQQEILGRSPELFARPGGLGKYSPGIWLSFLMLWFFCDPMFPQLFQRFFTARSAKTISRIMLFYPPVCTIVFIMPIAIGVMGRLSFPDLVGKQADRILPMVLTAISGDVVASLVIAAGLAALMSTMDSQLLTLSSIFSRDILPLTGKKSGENSFSGRIFVMCLSLLGLLLAYRPPATILQIATQTFTGLAVLFPTVIFGLYFKRVYALPAILSILIGEAAVLAFYLKQLPTAGLLPVVWVMATAFAVYLAAHLLIRLGTGSGGLNLQLPHWLKNRYTYLLGGIFLLGNDVWAWGKVQPVIFGLPAWLWYFVGLSALQVLVMVFLIRSTEYKVAPAAPDHRLFR